jgi:acyl-lipid omega-6 desaturase (Delta-12 desaturase)
MSSVSRPKKETRMNSGRRQRDTAGWQHIVEPYQHACAKRALWQLTNTFVPYALLWCAMYGALQISFWLAMPLAVLSAAFLVRIFIIFHDCAHGSYFKARWANDALGFVAGVLTFSPYAHWRWEHAIHHSSAGDLDRRGTGDMWTMTVQEYIAAPRARRLRYRLTRNPFVLFVIAPLFVFVVKQRFASSQARGRQRRSVWWTNLALLCSAGILGQIFGLGAYLLIQSIVIAVAGTAGLWLFYVQHQFEGVYWERGEHWDYAAVALRGSSYYKLPRVLQWLSGNIGFHHVHHLSPRIPNYHLQRCHESHRLFQQVKPVTLTESLKSLRFRLWDEQGKRLVGYRFLRREPCALEMPPSRD